MQPAYVKDNPATRVADMIAGVNARAGAPAGRGYGVGQTRVESAAMQQPPRPALPPDEVERLNRLAIEQGVPPEALGERPQLQPELEMDVPRQSAREFLGRVPVAFSPRLPDFTKIEGIDIKGGFVVVDGLRFPVPADDLRDMHLYVMEIVKEAVLAQFDRALASVLQPGGLIDTIGDVSETSAGNAQGSSEEVHPVRESTEERVEASEPGNGEGVPPEGPQT